MKMAVLLFILLGVLIFSASIAYAEEWSDAYQCEICKKWFKDTQVMISCCVLHPPGDCCHYGQEEVKADDPTDHLANAPRPPRELPPRSTDDEYGEYINYIIVRGLQPSIFRGPVDELRIDDIIDYLKDHEGHYYRYIEQEETP